MRDILVSLFLRLSRCSSCADAEYTRLPRSWWMRMFFPSRRLYRCSVCEQRIFGLKKDMDAVAWAMTTAKFFAAAGASPTPAPSAKS